MAENESKLEMADGAGVSPTLMPAFSSGDLPPLAHTFNFTRMRLTGLDVAALFGDEDGEHHYIGRRLDVSTCHICAALVSTDLEDKHTRSHEAP